MRKQWLEEVARVYLKRTRITLDQGGVDTDELKEAYGRGDSPDDFVSDQIERYGMTDYGRLDALLPSVQSDAEALNLPFGVHFCPAEGEQRGAALIFTTEPAFEADGPDRQQCDVVAVCEADNGDRHGERALALAEFICAALNAYADTPEGLERWKQVHPMLDAMREAGRQ